MKMLKFKLQTYVRGPMLSAESDGLAYTITQCWEKFSLRITNHTRDTPISSAEYPTIESAMQAANEHTKKVTKEKGVTYKLFMSGEYPSLKIIIGSSISHHIEKRDEKIYRWFKNGREIGFSPTLDFIVGRVFQDAGISGPSFEGFKLEEQGRRSRLVAKSVSRNFRISQMPGSFSFYVGFNTILTGTVPTSYVWEGDYQTIPLALDHVRALVKKDQECQEKKKVTYELLMHDNCPALRIGIGDDSYLIQKTRPHTYRWLKNCIEVGFVSFLYFAVEEVFKDAGVSGPSFVDFELKEQKERSHLVAKSVSRNFRISQSFGGNLFCVGSNTILSGTVATAYVCEHGSQTIPLALDHVRVLVKKDQEDQRAKKQKEIDKLVEDLADLQKRVDELTREK